MSTAVAPPTPRRRRRTWLWVVLSLALTGVVVALVAAAAQGLAERNRAFDPRSSTLDGHGVLAALLRRHHVDVEVVDTVAAARAKQAVVVVSNPEHVSEADLRSIVAARPTHVVVLSSKPGDVAAALDVTSRWVDGPLTRGAGCREVAADRAGAVATVGVKLSASRSERRCYPVDGASAWLGLDREGVPVDVLSARLLTNEHIGLEGNAALGMNLLGSDRRLVWYVAQPTPERHGRETNRKDDGPFALLPPWARSGMLAVLPALGVVVLWRGRRLGPILTEKLPVVVPASETVAGHGRLYARLRARDRAADALRAATVRRLARLLGAQDPARLAELVAARTGRSARDIMAVLAGPPPVDDVALTRLKQDLDRLEQEARQP